MPETTDLPVSYYLWTSIGVVGGLIFYGRFLVQWAVSESRKKSTIPIAFWYMSSCGSLLLLAFAVWSQSPLGALGQNLNIVIYGRNLAHIWRERGVLSKALNIALHTFVTLVATCAIAFVALTWYREYEINQQAPVSVAQSTWIWLGIGVAGQGLFAMRFLIQWIATERRRKSVVPRVFWEISLVAATLQCTTFTQRHEWVFAIGSFTTILIYGRNLWFIHSARDGEIARQGTE